jgi:Tfp pilus assembly protein PilN
MKAVNLLPSDHKGLRRPSPFDPLVKNPLLVLAIVFAVAVLGGLALELRSASSTVSSRQATLQQLEEQFAKLPKPKPAAVGAQQQQGARLSTVTNVAQNRQPWDGFLSAVSLVMPEDVWLLSMDANGQSATTPVAPATASTGTSTSSPAPATVVSPTAFTITGYTYTQPSVARLMRRLALVPWLKDVSLTTSTKQQLANHFVYQFTLGANVITLPEVGP